MRFVSWMRAVGRPGDDLLRVALGQLARRTSSPGQIDCAEDVLLALPRMLAPSVVEAVEPFLASPTLRLRELATTALSRPA